MSSKVSVSFIRWVLHPVKECGKEAGGIFCCLQWWTWNTDTPFNHHLLKCLCKFCFWFSKNVCLTWKMMPAFNFPDMWCLMQCAMMEHLSLWLCCSSSGAALREPANFSSPRFPYLDSWHNASVAKFKTYCAVWWMFFFSFFLCD